MGLGALAAVAGGSILSGLFGKNKQVAQPVGGYATRPKVARDALENTYLPDVLSYYDSPFHQTPAIRAGDFESDPAFASKAAARTQDYSDAVGGLFSPYVAPGGEVMAAGTDQAAAPMGLGQMGELLGRMAVMQGPTGKGANLWKRFQTSATPQDYADIGAAVQGKKAAGNGNYYDPVTGTQVDLASILNRYNRG